MLRVEEGRGRREGLHKLEDGEGGRRVVLVDRSQDGEDLRVEAGVPEAEQEGARDGQVLVRLDEPNICWKICRRDRSSCYGTIDNIGR